MNYNFPTCVPPTSTYMKIQRETLPNVGNQTEWEDLRSKINTSQMSNSTKTAQL